MKFKAVSGIMLALLFIGMLTLSFKIQPVKAELSGHFVDAVGTYFEITNSTYLNITLTSTETVHVILESVPRMVSFIIESNSSATSTVLTFTGFQPNATYYRYQNGYVIENFTTDSSGGYTYTQDISQPHHIFTAEEKLTLYINSDYTFTQDINEPIIVNASNIVIDGNGYTLQGPGSGYGFYLYNRTSVTIKNTTVKGWTNCIWVGYSSGNTVNGNMIEDSSSWASVLLWYSSYNNLTKNTIRNNAYAGIRLGYSCSNIISGNTMTDNDVGGIYLDASSDHNTFSNNTVVNSLVGVLMTYSDNNIISRNNLTLNTGWNMGSGIELEYSDENTITENAISLNDKGIRVYYSGNNIIYHNNFVDNSGQVAILSYYNTWDDGYPSGGNYWSDYTGVDVKSGPNQDQPSSDGIGDTAYVFDADNLDNYPLINPWTPIENSVEVKGKDYPVILVSNTTIEQIVATANTLHFKSSGPTGEKGYINVIFSMVNTTEIKVFIDGVKLTPPPFPVINTNGTHYFIYFELTLSTHNIAIQFAPLEYILTIYSSPTGVTFTVDGVPRTTPWSGNYSEDTSVSLEMPETHSGYIWSHWLEDGDPNRIKTVTMDTNITLTGVFTPPPSPPPSVGGKAIPIDKLTDKPELLVPWMWLALVIILPLVATVVFVKLGKERNED